MKNIEMKDIVDKAMQLSALEITKALFVIGGGIVDPDMNIVRAALLMAYERKEGEEKVDKLLDKLGM